MLDGDQAHLRLAYTLLFSLPSAPMLYYGEEIGMGDDLSLPGRLSVRTPMQWTDYGTGGFSTAPAERFVRPMVVDSDYGYQRNSVRTMRADPDSLLNWMAALMRVRRKCSEIGVGTCTALDTGHDAVLGLRFDSASSTAIILNNHSGSRRTVHLELDAREVATTTDLFTDRHYPPLDVANPKMRIAGYGYRWLRLRGIY
jgi:maltose alpha-D-glucosyltransferase/alpha-amylase